jgi:hypothetical protein
VLGPQGGWFASSGSLARNRWMVQCDAHQIQQVIINLAINALDAYLKLGALCMFRPIYKSVALHRRSRFCRYWGGMPEYKSRILIRSHNQRAWEGTGWVWLLLR